MVNLRRYTDLSLLNSKAAQHGLKQILCQQSTHYRRTDGDLRKREADMKAEERFLHLLPLLLLFPFCLLALGHFYSPERGANTENHTVSAIPNLI